MPLLRYGALLTLLFILLASMVMLWKYWKAGMRPMSRGSPMVTQPPRLTAPGGGPRPGFSLARDPG